MLEPHISSLSALRSEALESFDQSSDATGIHAFLSSIRDRLDLKHVVYHSPSLRGCSHDDPFLALTYPDDWQKRYRDQRYVDVDPVVQTAVRSVLPIDWSRLDRTGKRVEKMFRESIDAGIGRQGLTIPIRGPVNGVWGLFTVTTDDSPQSWTLRRDQLIRDIVVLGHMVHQRSYELTGRLEEPLGLRSISPRECEALSWTAEGKTVNDIATIMGLSPETVRGYLDSARNKLGALNRTHAVVRAIRVGIVR